MKLRSTLLMSAALTMVSLGAQAASDEYHLTIKDHQFTPATLEIPANTKVKLIVKNDDASAEEFESHDLKREKIIPAGGTAKILVGPLAAGEYNFVGEYHEDTAKGKLIVK